jgi:predicted branched-subunit amino acid permease
MKPINTIQISSTILIAIGFLVGLIPFGYLISLHWVIPLAILNIILSIIEKDKTISFNIIILILAVLSLTPIIGFLTRLIGLILSIISIKKVGKK